MSDLSKYSLLLLIAKSCLTLCTPWTIQFMESQASILEWVAFSFCRGSSQPSIEPGFPALQEDSSPAEPPGKPVGLGANSDSSLSLDGTLGCWAFMHAQSWPTLCNPMDCSLPGSLVHWIFQTRILEWVAISFSRGSSQPRDQIHISCIGRQILYHWAP